MSVCSVEFLVLLLVIATLCPLLPAVRLRQAAFALCNAGFLFSLVPNAASGLALGLFVMTGYVVARTLQRYPYRLILAVYVAGTVAAFLVLKQYEVLKLFLPEAAFPKAVAVVGISYMLFRGIHVAVDACQGQIESLTLWSYVNYQLNLFGLLAGPIQRYQEFAEHWQVLQPLAKGAWDVLKAHRRILYGVIKIAVVADACLFYYDRFSGAFFEHSSQSSAVQCAKLLLWFYLYPAYIYFNFSGYCDIVIGGAALLGMRMPENFDWPFLARNMIEYWTRWHRTLGYWIRDYVFTPMYATIARHLPGMAASLAFLCYFVALFLTGVWHGSTWNFVIFGLLNGLGVAAAKLWETWLIKRRGRQGFKAYLQSRPIRAVAVAANFHYVCLTILFFPADLHKTLGVLESFSNRVLHITL